LIEQENEGGKIGVAGEMNLEVDSENGVMHIQLSDL